MAGIQTSRITTASGDDLTIQPASGKKTILKSPDTTNPGQTPLAAVADGEIKRLDFNALDELDEADLEDDDLVMVQDMSDGGTVKKIKKSKVRNFRGAGGADAPKILTPVDGAGVGSNTNAPDAASLVFTAGRPYELMPEATDWATAFWEVSVDSAFTSPMTASLAITDRMVIQEVPVDQRGAIVLQALTEYWVRVTYQFVGGGATETSAAHRFKTSDGPDQWTIVASGPWNDVTFGLGKFVACGDAQFAWASDAAGPWNVVTGPQPGMNYTAISYGAGRFVAVGQTGSSPNRVAYATDPAGPWTVAAQPDGYNEQWWDVCFGGGRWVAISYNSTLFPGARGMWAPDPPNNWTPNSSGLIKDGYNTVAYGNGVFTAISSGNDAYASTSTDGSTWSYYTSVPGGSIGKVQFDGSKFVGCSRLGSPYIVSSSDGRNYTGHDSAQEGDWLDVTKGGGRYVAVGRTKGTNSLSVVMWADALDGPWTIGVLGPQTRGDRPGGSSESWTGITYGLGKFCAVGTPGIAYSETGEGPVVNTFLYDERTSGLITDTQVVAEYGLDPSADNREYGIFNLDSQELTDVVEFIRQGEVYRGIRNNESEVEELKERVNRLYAALTYERFLSEAGTIYKVTVSGGVFYIDGVQQDSITMNLGDTITFVQNDSSNDGHPLRIYDDANKTNLIEEGVDYGPGVETYYENTWTRFTPTAAGTYSYQCENHAAMGGTITVN